MARHKFHHRLIFYYIVVATFFVAIGLFVNYDLSMKNFSVVTSGPRALTHNPYRPVCKATEPSKGKCFADITLNLSGKPLTGLPATTGSYGPLQFHTAYNLPCTPGGSVQSVCATPSSYGPETVAIVDAGNFSSGVSGIDTSLSNYDQYFAIAACSSTDGCLSVVNQQGSTSNLPADAGWSDEIALDIETVHMICQTCKIVLVEANDASANNLALANLEASTFSPIAISNSWGSSSDASSLDSYFQYSNIADVASLGDSGTVSVGAAWPADIPNEVGVAGTTLQLNANNTASSETLWNGSGGGCSNYYTAPSWQSSLSNWATAGCGTYRSFGDLAADGDPNTGAAVNVDGTWYQIGGTSLSAPIIAGIYGLSSGINSSNTPVENLYINNNSTNFNDITSGNDCTSSGQLHCTAATGFDTPTGLGSPNGIGAFMTLPYNPINLSASEVSQSQINLAWSINPAATSIAGYYVYRNGQKIASTTSTSYSDTGLTINTTYQYYVVAYSSSSVLSAPSTTVSNFTALPADINQDGHINLLDLSILVSKYGQSGVGIGRADINQDGIVNLLDLSILVSKYGSE